MDTLKAWHEIAASGDASRLEEVIAPDCVFLSPVVHTPQEGGESDASEDAGGPCPVMSKSQKL